MSIADDPDLPELLRPKPPPTERPRNDNNARRDKSPETPRQAVAELSERWGERHAARVRELTDELALTDPEALADERLVQRLAANSAAVSEILGRAQLQLAERLERFVDAPKSFLALARSLKEVTTTQNSTMRTVQELLSALSTVRTQRAVTARYTRGESWHEHVGGGFLQARRDPANGHPTAN